MKTKTYLIQGISKTGMPYYQLCVSDTEKKIRIYSFVTAYQYGVLKQLYKTYEKEVKK